MANGPDIYVFELNGRYRFKQYFEQSAMFDALSEYYVRDEYHFEVPVDDFDAVAEILLDHGYEPTIVDDPEPYCVVIGQYRNAKLNIPAQSVVFS